MAAGQFHTVAIKNDGTLWAWGRNSYGQLGDGNGGTGITSPVPVQVSETDNNGNSISGDKWIAVSAGAAHTVAIRNDGTLWAWGINNYGQLGDGTDGTGSEKTYPVQVSETDFYGYPISGDKWISVSAGVYHTVAIRNDGTLWAWGDNRYGQLGDGTGGVLPVTEANNKPLPVQVSETDNNSIPISGDKWIAVSAGYYHAVAIRNDGTPWTWGRNSYGQLGDGTIDNKSRPQEINNATDWITVFACSYHTVAIAKDGTLWAWGYNTYGQLGDGTTTNRHSPTLVVGENRGWASVSGGEFHTIAHRNDGTLWAWGGNACGQLGFDSAGEDILYPKRIGVAADLIGTSAGNAHSVALRRSGILWTWGDNWEGQLGNGTTDDDSHPKPTAVKWK